MKRIRVFFSALAAILLLAGCDIINPEEQIPAYIYIPEVEVSANAGEGTASANITEVWVTVNGSFLGAYPIPATVPILEEGVTDIAIQAGVKDNGLGNRPEIYPFLEAFREDIELGPNEVDTLRPVFNYLNTVNFALVEGFEVLPHSFQDVRAGLESQVGVVQEGAFEGGSSLRIDMDASNFFVEVATAERFPQIVSNNSARVYLEVNYKSDVPALFGLIGYDAAGMPLPGGAQYEAGFRPTAEWKKIYFNLSLLAIEMRGEEYQIVLQSAIPLENGTPSLSEASIWLDNIKLLHF